MLCEIISLQIENKRIKNDPPDNPLQQTRNCVSRCKRNRGVRFQPDTRSILTSCAQNNIKRTLWLSLSRALPPEMAAGASPNSGEVGQMDSTSSRRIEQSLYRSHIPRRRSFLIRIKRRLVQVHGRLPRDTESAPPPFPSEQISLDDRLGTE